MIMFKEYNMGIFSSLKFEDEGFHSSHMVENLIITEKGVCVKSGESS